jgi:hypothetical protein
VLIRFKKLRYQGNPLGDKSGTAAQGSILARKEMPFATALFNTVFEGPHYEGT